MSDLEKIKKHLDALFIYDERGRLQQPRMGRVPDTSYPAPRFFIGRSTEGNTWRYRGDVTDELIDKLEPLAATIPFFSGPGTDLPEVVALRDALAAQHPIESFWCGPAFYFPKNIDAPTAPVAITTQNADLLHPHFTDSIEQLADTAPLYAAVLDRVAVCTCESVRIAGGVHEAGLETAAAYRGQGLAPRVTAAWANAVRTAGDEPLYSTSWENAASRRVAEKLGLIPYGEDLHFS